MNNISYIITELNNTDNDNISHEIDNNDTNNTNIIDNNDIYNMDFFILSQ